MTRQFTAFRRDLDATGKLIADLLQQQSAIQAALRYVLASPHDAAVWPLTDGAVLLLFGGKLCLRDKAGTQDLQSITRQLYDKEDQSWVERRIEPKVSKDDVEQVVTSRP